MKLLKTPFRDFVMQASVEGRLQDGFDLKSLRTLRIVIADRTSEVTMAFATRSVFPEIAVVEHRITNRGKRSLYTSTTQDTGWSVPSSSVRVRPVQGSVRRGQSAQSRLLI